MARPVNIPELFVMWDSEGKCESKGWDGNDQRVFFYQHLHSPPAKMFKSLAFTTGYTLLPDNALLDVPDFLPLIRNTTDILFSPLETDASTRVKAAQADNTGVDLSQWAEPDETP